MDAGVTDFFTTSQSRQGRLIIAQDGQSWDNARPLTSQSRQGRLNRYIACEANTLCLEVEAPVSNEFVGVQRVAVAK